MKILVTPTSFLREENLEARKLLESFADEVVYNPVGKPLTEEEIIPLLDGCDGYIAGVDYITEKVIASAPDQLKVISRYGTGIDRVNIEAAGKRGIIVTNTPGANAEAVADLTFGLMLSVARKIPLLDRSLREGAWVRSAGVELYRKTLGILGFGAVGRSVARRASGFSMRILVFDPYVRESMRRTRGIDFCSFDEVIANSDFISLHVPLNQETKNMINTSSIEKMKNGVIIINTSRGGLIDDNAVYRALKQGKIRGLGLDVFNQEPPGSSPLFELDNVVVTPHTGAHTYEAISKMALMAVRNLIDILEGGTSRNIVNRQYLARKRGRRPQTKSAAG